MKFQLLFIFLLAFGICAGQNSKPNLKTNFSETEILDLNKITDFFQNELCGSTDERSFGNCLMESLPEYAELVQNYVGGQIRYRKQKKLYRKLSNTTFNKIWRLRIAALLFAEPKYEYTNISFSGNPEIIDFVKALGEENEYLKKYTKNLENIGEFETGTLLTMDIMRQPNKWNLDDRNMQIFLAIHYLTQNDNINRDKKAKRLQKRHDRIVNR